MQVINTVMMCVRDFFKIATLITFWVVVIDQSHSMQGLMNISNVVDNKSESE